MARTSKAKATEEAPVPAIIAYKGFNQDLKCRDFQYEIGKTFVHKGKVEACAGGFHACEYPLNVFDYYPPSRSRFAVVELGGKTHRDGPDTKIAAAEITIKAELRLPELIATAIKFVFDRATWSETDKATGYQGAASSTGTRGAASSTGDQGAASSTGYQGAASSTGYQGAASSTGDQGAASSTGDQGAASALGKHSAAMAAGTEGKVRGIDGAALFLVERLADFSDDHGKIIAAWSGIVGRDGIKPDTWYTLRGGKPVEVAD